MALDKRKPIQQPLFVSTASLNVRSHPFYEAVNKVLDAHHFDVFVEDHCAKFSDDGGKGGRPGLAPGVYFRCLLAGYFEGIDSERGIDWRCSDSNSLKLFLGLPIDQPAPDHSTISRTRRLIDLKTHAEVFREILKVLANHGLVEGKTVGVDSTTLDFGELSRTEANAAMRSIVRRDSGEGYQQFLERLARESGIETGEASPARPTREDLARLDKKRKNKASNDDWQNPSDPDAKITRMKDGTIVQTTENLRAVIDDERVAEKISDDFLSEAVIDKGYHSKQTLLDLEEMEVRSYASEPERRRQKWDGQDEARQAVYANRRRVKGEWGKRLLRSRGEKLERTVAHCYETGGMRRLHLRGRDNIAKRVLIHAAAFNVGLMMRLKYGLRKPPSHSKATAAACALSFALVEWLGSIFDVVRLTVATLSSRRTMPQRNPLLCAA